MRRTRGGTALVVVAVLALTGCASFDAPEEEGVPTFPAGGVPTQVFWPSDWLEGLPGEHDGVGGSIVGLRLSHDDGVWVWRIESSDPDPETRDQSRGLDALIDAVHSDTLSTRHIRLADEQLAAHRVSALEAARLSGEVYPGPRLVSLRLGSTAGTAVWTATLYDNDGAETSVVTIDADSGEILDRAP